ncbi:MAG TPA: bifunctional riboflavin kinase/FAD synthetase [Pseudolysinimonas sp.]|nr:bifunctional riboflavin kinase/FAD synthetase [Pseudolysinimonas sp.]
MQIFEGLAAVPQGFGPSAVTIGKFDGLHLGHRGVIAQLRARAGELGLVSTVVTFDRHPLAVLKPELAPTPLVSPAQRLELLSESGVDAVVVLAFLTEMAQMLPEDFVRTVLVDRLNAKLVLAGSDFRFGLGGAGDTSALEGFGERYGFEVALIDDVRLPEGERRASSKWIRELLSKGRVHEAGTLLGRPPAIRSVVVHGERRGHELGFPTANLDPKIEGMVPVDGVYSGWAIVDGVTYGAAVSIGNNPTFDGVLQHQVEAHLLDVDEDLDIYGREIEIQFVEHVRPMVKFDSIETLIAQMEDDVAGVRRTLGRPAPAP